jgi:hypothetical protein
MGEGVAGGFCGGGRRLGGGLARLAFASDIAGLL